MTPTIRVFNPRGEEFSDVEEVGILCGLILECIDRNAIVQNSIPNLPANARQVMSNWRQENEAGWERNSESVDGYELVG